MLSPEANRHQHLFLGGILGEILALPFVGDYLKVNKRILENMGVEDVEWHIPNSLFTAHDNAEDLAQRLLKLYGQYKKPIVIFAHSKACLEVVICLSRHLGLFERCVSKIICVQPPFKGSSVIESYDFLKPLGRFWPGLKSLGADYYEELFKDNLVSSRSHQKYMKKNLLVIKGYKRDSKQVSWIIRPSHLLMKTLGHDNDGLVKLKDQILPFAEYREIVMELDHSDLFTSKLLSNRDDEFRKNLMKDLINWSVAKEQKARVEEQSSAPLEINVTTESAHA